MADRDTEPLWKYEDVARFLSLSPSSIRRLVSRDMIPSIKICGCRRFDREQIKAWARSQAASGATAPDDPSRWN